VGSGELDVLWGLGTWEYSKSLLPTPYPYPKVGILFYRAHYLVGTPPIDALCQAFAQRHLQPIPIFVSSLRDPDVQAELLCISSPKSKREFTEYNQFSLARLETETPQLDLWRQLDVPVLQVILSGS